MSGADPADGSTLYNRALLDMAAQAGDAQALPGATHRASARSPVCGSTVDVALTLDAQGRVSGFGYRLEACALTKSVVAVLRQALPGATRGDVVQAQAALAALLDGKASDGLWPGARWAGMMVLAPLKDYPARHSAVQLPLAAVEKAFDNKAI